VNIKITPEGFSANRKELVIQYSSPGRGVLKKVRPYRGSRLSIGSVGLLTENPSGVNPASEFLGERDESIK
jgi:hypothetical protein